MPQSPCTQPSYLIRIEWYYNMSQSTVWPTVTVRLKATPTEKKDKRWLSQVSLVSAPFQLSKVTQPKTFSLLLPVRVGQTGWMETQTRTMSHNHAVDFTVGMCIPVPTKESCSTHTDTQKHRPQRHRGPLLVFTGSTKKNRGGLSVLLKYWNYSIPNSWRGVFTKTDPSD